MFPLAPVGTAEKKTQVPWNPAEPYKSLGWREIEASPRAAPKLEEYGIRQG